MYGTRVKTNRKKTSNNMDYLKEYFKDRENKKLTAAVLMFNLFITILILNYLNNDTDILWHFKVGQEIVESKQISFVNNFTFQEGTYWNQHEWLFDVFIYLVINYTGMIGFTVVKYVLEIVTIFICLGMAKPKNSAIWICVYTILKLLVPCSFANRPGEYSIIGVLIALWAFGTASHKYRTREWAMGITALVMTNIHGGMIGTTAGLLMVGYLSDKMSDLKYGIKKQQRTQEKLRLIQIFMFVSLLNPMGVNVWTQSMYVSSLRSTQYILEWKPFNFGVISGILMLFVFISIGYSVSKRNFSSEVLRVAVWVCALGVLSLMTARSITVLFYVWITFGYRYSSDILSDYFLSGQGNKKKRKNLGNTANFIAWSLVELTSLVLVIIQIITLEYRDFEAYASRGVSVEILDKLEERYVDGDRILAGYSVNNNVMFKGMKVFVDTRQTPYDTVENESLVELIELSEGKDIERCNEIIDAYKFNYIWTSDELDLEWYLKQSSDYKLLLEDKKSGEKLYTRL